MGILNLIPPDKLKEARSIIDGNGSFLVVAHVDPDGDCVGSMLAVSRFLEGRGKKARCFIPGSVPDNYMKLRGMDRLVPESVLEEIEYEAVISVDTPTLERAGNIIDPAGGGEILNIDHHPTNEKFGTVNLVVDDSSATAVIVYHLLSSYSDEEITEEIANYLYLGIVMDTGCFRFKNTDSESLRVAAELVDKGARAEEIVREFYIKRKYEAVKLLSLVLGSIELFERGKIAVMKCTMDMLETCGVRMEDTEGFIDFGTAIEGVKLVAFLRETESGQVRASLRSADHYDVASFAETLGGGGHTNAAGLSMESNIDKAKAIVVAGFREML